MHEERTIPGHGINIAGFADIHFFQGVASFLQSTLAIDMTGTELLVLRLDQVVGKSRQSCQLLPENPLLILLVNLELLVMSLKQINRKARHMGKIVLARLRYTQISMMIGDIAGNAADDKYRYDHQRQRHDQYLPAKLESAERLIQIRKHMEVSSSE